MTKYWNHIYYATWNHTPPKPKLTTYVSYLGLKRQDVEFVGASPSTPEQIVYQSRGDMKTSSYVLLGLGMVMKIDAFMAPVVRSGNHAMMR